MNVTKPKMPVLIQSQSNELCGMYCQYTKNEMLGICTTMLNGTPNPAPVNGFERIVDHRLMASISRYRLDAWSDSCNWSGNKTDFTALAGRPSAPDAFQVAPTYPIASIATTGVTAQNVARRRWNNNANSTTTPRI